jgi:Fe2+ transport system protein FeoA
MPRTTTITKLTYLDRLPAGAKAFVETISSVKDIDGPGWGRGWGRRRTRGRARGGGPTGGAAATTATMATTAIAERLAALGFVPGAQLAVQSNYGSGPIIVSIRGARVAVGRGQAHKILVRRDMYGVQGGADGQAAGE